MNIDRITPGASDLSHGAADRHDTPAGPGASDPGMAALAEERDALEQELKKVKRKYRRATTDAQTARQEVALLTQRLAEAEARLAAIEARSLSGLVRRLVRSGAAARLKPRRSLKARRAAQVEAVRRSHLFNADWYLATYPDIAEARLDPALHYVLDGWSEGRDPGPEFSTSRYLKSNRDVAQSGLNPLLHYLEHGLAEGRSAGGGVSALPRRSIEDFGPAAPVFHAAIAAPVAERWVRHYQLDPARSLLRVGALDAAYLAPGDNAPVIAAVARFAHLSGLGEAPPSSAGEDAGEGPAMIDSWFAGQSLLRTRWDLGEGSPHVIRGYQRGRDGAMRLIGEGLVTSRLDPLDFPAAHPLLPILFLTCRPDGECVATTNLFFPSLCRGGHNYAELLLARGEEAKSPLALGAHHARSLERILAGAAAPLLRAVRVDLAGADGTHPMFQADCQDWLDWVLRIDMGEAIAPAKAGRAEIAFLKDRVSGTPGTHRARAGSSAALVLPSDAMPTIAALVAAAEGATDAAAATNTMSMIVAQADPAKPALAVAVPHGLSFPTSLSAAAFPLAFPRLEGAAASERMFPAAIRTRAERGLADSELLQPLARPLPILSPPVPRPLVVAIEPALWTLAALEAGLAALDLQEQSETIDLCMIGAVDAPRRAVVERVFAGRTTSRVHVHAFVEGLSDADVVHLGSGVILHDPRTLSTFQALLADGSSASCPLLSCTKQGKGWAVAVSDGGKARRFDGGFAPLPLAPHAEALWRSTLPVRSQPVDLWAARPAVLRNAPDEAAAPHLLCTWITASYYEPERPQQQATLTLPVARADLALRVEELVG